MCDYCCRVDCICETDWVDDERELLEKKEEQYNAYMVSNGFWKVDRNV